jgi:hypothetical protein
MTTSLITLTTDFGLSDAYVAEMKGVILSINPDVHFVDICHTVKPQNISQGAFVLSTAYGFFPPRTIHVVVVDPGAGGQRRAILVRTPLADFVAPDNGILTYVLEDHATVSGRTAKLSSEVEAVSLTKSEYWRNPVSPTFHGRDIFAPVAARLSLGTPPLAFGERVNSINTVQVAGTSHQPNGMITGQIVHIDNFGNLISNIKDKELVQGRDRIIVTVGGKRIHGVCRTYQEGSGLLALVGSHGYLEVALKNGSAADFLGVGTGDQVRITMQTGGRP